MEQLSFEAINRIDLVDFLSTIGIEPKKRKGYRYYYVSPLAGHPIHRPSFIINRHLNRWRETTTRQSGALADLAVRLYDCTIGELTAILRAALPPVLHSGVLSAPDDPPVITIERTHDIRSAYLEHYLFDRRIPLHVARNYCLEAWYSRGNKVYATLAFPTQGGGFELFDRHHRYRVPPCGPTHIVHGASSLAVFRHVLDMLTYVSLVSLPASRLTDLLVLNASIPFPAIQEIMAPYRQRHLFLPGDAAGILFSRQAVRALPECHDHRSMYDGYPTLNDWICHPGTATRPKIPVFTPQVPGSPNPDPTARKKPGNSPPSDSPQDKRM